MCPHGYEDQNSSEDDVSLRTLVKNSIPRIVFQSSDLPDELSYICSCGCCPPESPDGYSTCCQKVAINRDNCKSEGVGCVLDLEDIKLLWNKVRLTQFCHLNYRNLFQNVLKIALDIFNRTLCLGVYGTPCNRYEINEMNNEYL